TIIVARTSHSTLVPVYRSTAGDLDARLDVDVTILAIVGEFKFYLIASVNLRRLLTSAVRFSLQDDGVHLTELGVVSPYVFNNTLSKCHQLSPLSRSSQTDVPSPLDDNDRPRYCSPPQQLHSSPGHACALLYLVR